MSWLDDLERSLEQRLDVFLHANPHQDVLLREQHLRDRQHSLEQRRRQLQDEAQDLRKQLLALAAEVRDWTTRSERARTAGAQDLAARAEQHVHSLMKQGRQLWRELDGLGGRFRAVEAELATLASANKKPSSGRSLDQDWALFEAQQELEELRRQHGFDK
ncbi:MAG: hercynine metabolism protein [Synechococcus sp.]